MRAANVRRVTLLAVVLLTVLPSFAHVSGDPTIYAQSCGGPWGIGCDPPSCDTCPGPPAGYCLGETTCCQIPSYTGSFCSDCFAYNWWGAVSIFNIEWWDNFGTGCNSACGEAWYWRCAY